MLIRKILKQLCDGIAAGLLITIGCCVDLALSGSDTTKWVGAILFSVALLTICYKGYSLYTGRIGFLLDNLNKDYISGLLLGLLGNVIATAVFGIMVQYALPSLHDSALAMCELKLAQQQWWQTLIRGIMCGVLMYVAVAIYKEKKSIVGVLFAIPVFILSGFEHSIADMGYFAIGGIYSAKAFGFIWLVILGNTIGALILPVLALAGRELKKHSCAEKTVAANGIKPTAKNEVKYTAANVSKPTAASGVKPANLIEAAMVENTQALLGEKHEYTADVETFAAEDRDE